jgi:hypothetical protein
VHNAFYEPAGTEAFVASPATAGPWSAQAQHGGPPSALAARAMQRHEPDEGQRLARVVVDILRPVPVAKVTVKTRVVRPGRRVALVEAVMEADGQEVLHARGWRIALTAGGLPVTAGDTATAEVGPATAADTAAAPAGPVSPAAVDPAAAVASTAAPAAGPSAAGSPEPPAIPPEQPLPAFFDGRLAGYLSAIEWRFLSGGNFDARERARVWTRPRIPLIEGEELSPMGRALLVADSGSGVSAVLDPMRFLFINVDLTVALQRDPAGGWLLLDAATTIGDRGTGVAETILSDADGPCGRALQTLLVAPR